MSRTRSILIGLGFVVISAPLSAEEVSLSARWSIDRQNRNVIDILFEKNGKLVLEPIIASSSPAANDPSYFKVTGPTGKDVKIQVLKGQERDGKIGKITLVPKEQITKPSDYKVQFTPKAGTEAFLFAAGYTLRSDVAAKPFVLKKEALKTDIDFVNRNKAIENKVSVLAGDSGPSVSIRLNTGIDKWDNGQIWRIQAQADADATYKPKNDNKYINSIIGQLDGLFVSPIPRNNPFKLRGVFESGLTSRIETDQDFNLVNGTIGVTEWCAFQAPYIADLARKLCIWRAYDSSPNTPIATLSYDYVGKLKQDVSPSDPATKSGNNRLRGRFYWSLTIAHNVPMPMINLNYDVSFLIDEGVIYDFRETKWMPDNRLSVDISPTAETTKAVPSITVTYVNGKTTPTFQQFDAFLAGLKLAF
jgi:hypothetical protein